MGMKASLEGIVILEVDRAQCRNTVNFPFQVEILTLMLPHSIEVGVLGIKSAQFKLCLVT